MPICDLWNYKWVIGTLTTVAFKSIALSRGCHNHVFYFGLRKCVEYVVINSVYIRVTVCMLEKINISSDDPTQCNIYYQSTWYSTHTTP